MKENPTPYHVARKIREDEPLHGGNIEEAAGGYFADKLATQSKADLLNKRRQDKINDLHYGLINSLLDKCIEKGSEINVLKEQIENLHTGIRAICIGTIIMAVGLAAGSIVRWIVM